VIARLALEDGAIFTGVSFGAAGTRTGEVVFNTAMAGYQEVFTDPSYCGQIVVMTYPQMGNYGVNEEDFESGRPYLSGFVVKELPPRPSNYRATASLPNLCAAHGVLGLAGMDTRALTRRIRIYGALRGVISTEIADELELVRLATQSPPMEGSNLVTQVSPSEPREWSEPLGAWTPLPTHPGVRAAATGGGERGAAAVGEPPRAAPAAAAVERQPHVVAVDCGAKHNILRNLVTQGCRVTVVPADAPPGAIRELRPDGLVLGNGPGDPAAVTGTIATVRELLGRLPIFGICLGHQLLGLALGAKTYKLRFGHHGVNTPVLNQPAGRVEITSQNHGFAVDIPSLERVGGLVTHVNLNDRSLEGFIHPDKQVMAVQYHPEASPGPHDAAYLFRQFAAVVRTGGPINRDLLAT